MVVNPKRTYPGKMFLEIPMDTRNQSHLQNSELSICLHFDRGLAHIHLPLNDKS